MEQLKRGKAYFGSRFHRVFNIITVEKAGQSSPVYGSGSLWQVLPIKKHRKQ